MAGPCKQWMMPLMERWVLGVVTPFRKFLMCRGYSNLAPVSKLSLDVSVRWSEQGRISGSSPCGTYIRPATTDFNT
jgi:hypothetical protein